MSGKGKKKPNTEQSVECSWQPSCRLELQNVDTSVPGDMIWTKMSKMSGYPDSTTVERCPDFRAEITGTKGRTFHLVFFFFACSGPMEWHAGKCLVEGRPLTRDSTPWRFTTSWKWGSEWKSHTIWPSLMKCKSGIKVLMSVKITFLPWFWILPETDCSRPLSHSSSSF